MRADAASSFSRRERHEPPTEAVPRFLRRITAIRELTPEESVALTGMLSPPISMTRDSDLIVEGATRVRGYFIEEGWAGRYRMLNDGRRQILNFLVPGDCVGASATVAAADHCVGALTPCRVYPFSISAMIELERRFPALQRIFDWSGRRDKAMLAERVVDLGRRTARERVARLILELLYRLRFVGLADGQGFDLPLTQETLGDALGLSNVHVNRTLRRLKGEGLIDYGPGRIVAKDVDALSRIAEFDEDYLHHDAL